MIFSDIRRAEGRTPPDHLDMRTFPLFEKGPDCDLGVSVSHYLPGGGAAFGPQPVEVMYYVLDGEITVESDLGDTVLSAGQAVHIGKGENKGVRNAANFPASILVVANLSGFTPG